MTVSEADALSSELVSYRATFRDNRVIADQIAAGLTIDAFNWRPAPDRWSIAQCLVHLNVSGDLYAARMEAAIRKARADGLMGSGPFQYGPFSRWMLRAVDPANPRKLKSPGKFDPPTTANYVVRDVLDAFHQAGARWERCLTDANGLDLARVKVRSPALPFMHFSLGALFAIEAAHERRHLLQAQAVFDMHAC
jgi:hypothetical protein